MLEGIEVLIHSSIKFYKGKIIYIDPFKIDRNYSDADYIFITHDHYDHYSEEDISKIIKDNTEIITPESLLEKMLMYGFKEEYITIVKPNMKYEINGIRFETVPAYNITEKFHPKENGWVGYMIELDGIRYYIAGDTDVTEESRKVKCDVAFVPVGGTYTMDCREAADLINEIKPKIAVPIHYGSIVGTNEDAKKFVRMLDNEIQGKILMEEQ